MFFPSLAKWNAKQVFLFYVPGLEDLHISSLSCYPCVFKSQDMLASFNQTCQKGRKAFSSYTFEEKNKRKNRLALKCRGLYKYNPETLIGGQQTSERQKKIPFKLKPLQENPSRDTNLRKPFFNGQVLCPTELLGLTTVSFCLVVVFFLFEGGFVGWLVFFPPYRKDFPALGRTA